MHQKLALEHMFKIDVMKRLTLGMFSFLYILRTFKYYLNIK